MTQKCSAVCPVQPHVVPASKANLSPARRQLIELMQQLNFGRLEQFTIRNGEPVFDPPPSTTREIKFGSINGPRPEIDADDFLLKASVTELLETLSRLGTGRIAVLEIRHGLPFRMQISEQID